MDSHTHLQRFWDYIYKDLFEENDYNFMIYGTSIWMSVWFYGLCGFYTFADLTGRPKWLQKYKVQPGTNQPMDRRKFWKMLVVANFNQLVVSGPWLTLVYHLHQLVGSSNKTEHLPGLGRIIRDLAFCVIFQEFMFYNLHRLFHWPPLYKRIHKKHHEWQAPASGFTAVYAHPLEHLIVNLPQFTLGPVIMGSHGFTVMLWYTRSIIETITAHSGYHLPFTMSPEFHDFHHLNFIGNYGVYGWLDRFHGTDKSFRGSVQEKRHQVLMSLTPMSEQHPMKKKKQ